MLWLRSILTQVRLQLIKMQAPQFITWLIKILYFFSFNPFLDPEWFIPDPDPATIFCSAGSYQFYLSTFEIIKNKPYNQSKRWIYQLLYLPSSISHYSTTAQNLQAYKLEIQFNFLAGCGTNKFRIQEKFRIRPDPDLQYCKKKCSMYRLSVSVCATFRVMKHRIDETRVFFTEEEKAMMKNPVSAAWSTYLLSSRSESGQIYTVPCNFSML